MLASMNDRVSPNIVAREVGVRDQNSGNRQDAE
jgi:hypothetical protein